MAQHPTLPRPPPPSASVCLSVPFFSFESFAWALLPSESFLHTPQTPARALLYEATWPEPHTGESFILASLLASSFCQPL